MVYICCYGFLFCVPNIVAAGNVETAEEVTKNVILKKFPMKVSQGVAVDKNFFYAISNTRIVKCTKDKGKIVANWQADRNKKSEAHFKHLNSGTVVKNLLYCAHSRFPANRNDNTVEIFNVKGETLEHQQTIPMPSKHGSLTWIDRRNDGSWWLCYGVYGKKSNQQTKLVKYRYENGTFTEERVWTFPPDVISHWGSMSCSGGSWSADGYLYVTGHDRAEAYVLQINQAGKLSYVRTSKGLGIYGQAIAWDRTADKPVLWGIVKKKHVSQTLVAPVE